MNLGQGLRSLDTPKGSPRNGAGKNDCAFDALRSLGRLELGAKKFHEQRTTGPLLFESAPALPSAGFNVTFEDWTLDTHLL